MIDFKIKPVEEMTIDELIGQVIMIGLPYSFLDEEYKKFIFDYKIGNYILFARNYKDTRQMKTLMKEMYQYTLEVTGSFPLVSIDQEGGMVVRLFKDVTFPASPLTTSSTAIANAPYETGKIIGKDMLKLGLNVNLAPCLEINSNLENPLVNIRGYGATKEIVLKNATSFVHGLQESGALSCVKHFPGAGSSTKDSHLELPIVEEDKEYLINNNMYPFLKLLDSDAVMSSHSLFTAFDDVPTTLSSVFLTDILRNQVGYEGLIISDGMEMKAILDNYGIEKGTIMALKAGCDILLSCHYYDCQKEAFDSIKKALANGELSLDEIKEKVHRINKAKQKLLDGLNKYFTDEEYVIDEQEHKLMQKIVDNSYTLIMGKAPTLTSNTLIISSNALVGSIVEDEFDDRNLTKALKKNFPNNEVIEFIKDESFINEALTKAQKYQSILVYSYDAYKDDVQKLIINELLKTDKEVFVVSMKGPIDQKYFNGLVNYSCLYEYTPNSIRTIISQLKDNIPLNGKLPK